MAPLRPFKLWTRKITAQHIPIQVSSREARAAHRDHDAKFATFWRRLGFAKTPPAFSWGIEDDIAATLAREITKEIDKVIKVESKSRRLKQGWTLVEDVSFNMRRRPQGVMKINRDRDRLHANIWKRLFG